MLPKNMFGPLAQQISYHIYVFLWLALAVLITICAQRLLEQKLRALYYRLRRELYGRVT